MVIDDLDEFTAFRIRKEAERRANIQWPKGSRWWHMERRLAEDDLLDTHWKKRWGLTS